MQYQDSGGEMTLQPHGLTPICWNQSQKF